MADDIEIRGWIYDGQPIKCVACGMTVMNTLDNIGQHVYFHEEMQYRESKYSVVQGYGKPIVFERLSND